MITVTLKIQDDFIDHFCPAATGFYVIYFS